MQPRGLLSIPQMPEERRLTPQEAMQEGVRSGALFDGIAGALNSLRHRPSQDMSRMLLARDTRRGQVADEARARQEQAQAQNRTMQVAAQMFGEDSDIFRLAAAGMISAQDVAKAVLTRGQGVRGIEINGQLVNPETGAVIGDYRDQGATMSEAEQEIARLESIGIPRDVAIKIKEGVFTVSRDPMTGEAVILDKSNQRVIFDPENQQPQATPVAPTTTAPATPSQQFPDASDAFGAEGLLKGGINAASDFIGLGTPFQGVNETSAYFGVLQEQIINDVASAYQRQPPSWLLQNVRELTPQALSGMGPQRAQTKLTALRNNFATELETARRQAGGPLTPTNRQTLQERIINIEAAMARIDGALARFGGGETGDIEAIADRWAQ